MSDTLSFEVKPDDRGRVNLSSSGSLAERYLVVTDPSTGRIQLEPLASLPAYLVDMARERPEEFARFMSGEQALASGDYSRSRQ